MIINSSITKVSGEVLMSREEQQHRALRGGVTLDRYIRGEREIVRERPDYFEIKVLHSDGAEYKFRSTNSKFPKFTHDDRYLDELKIWQDAS